MNYKSKSKKYNSFFKYEKTKKLSKIKITLFFIFLIWFVFITISPLVIPNGIVKDLSGYTIISENKGTIDKIPPPWNVAYEVGDKMCHQKSERSFFLNNNQMPFCSRCMAIWFGLAIGLFLLIFYKFELDERFIIIIFIGILPIAFDGLGQLFEFWESTNLIRVITGFLMGFVCGISIGVIVDEVKDIISSKKQNSYK